MKHILKKKERKKEFNRLIGSRWWYHGWVWKGHLYLEMTAFCFYSCFTQRLKFHPALLGLVSSDILIFSVELVLWDLDPEFFLWRSLYFLGKSHFCGILQSSSKLSFIIFISWVLPATACVDWMWWNRNVVNYIWS